jgi:Ca2+/Na+ antiporter
MNWNYKVENRIAASADSLQSLGSKITGLTIIIEIIFIVSSSINFTLKDDKKEVVKMIKIPLVSSILHFLAIIQLFSTLYYLYVWVTLKYRLSVEREQQKNQTDIKP